MDQAIKSKGRRLTSLMEAAEMFLDLFPLDCCVVIGDSEGVIRKYIPGKTFDVGLKEGNRATPNSAVDKIITTRQSLMHLVPQERFGIPVKSIGQPVFEDGVLTGAIVLVMTQEVQRTLNTSAQSITQGTERTTAMMQELSASAKILSGSIGQLSEKGNRVIDAINKTDEILKFVSAVANNSNLLGLNAAIEAARAGELGRGFAVVAQEIRKMADDSALAVDDIKNTLRTIRSETDGIISDIEQALLLGEQQQKASEEVAEDMEALIQTAYEVERIANFM
ncbi:MAG: hypothetical protein PWP51_71 [Clostridiales bacterium]|nr:hypothetical protein [Clostridiales bacterium]